MLSSLLLLAIMIAQFGFGLSLMVLNFAVSTLTTPDVFVRLIVWSSRCTDRIFSEES